MTAEKKLSKKFQAVAKRAGCFVQSLESSALPNLPDLYLVLEGRGTWLELKVCATSRCKIPFRKGQPAWHCSHSEAGGRSFLLVLAGDELMLFAGAGARQLSFHQGDLKTSPFLLHAEKASCERAWERMFLWF